MDEQQKDTIKDEDPKETQKQDETIKEEKNHEERHHATHKHEHKADTILSSGIVIIAVILGVIVLLNFVITTGLFMNTKERLAEAEEFNRPAEITLIALTQTGCPECMNIAPIIENVKKANVNVKDEKSVDFASDEAKALIQKYSITKLPTVIINGEYNKTKIQSFKIINDAAVFDSVVAPYADAVSGATKGLVKATLIEVEGCTDCFDISNVVTQFKQVNVKIVEEKKITQNNAASLISKYKIEKLPSVVFSSDLSEYPSINEAWQQLGEIAQDGSYIFTQTPAPYYDVGLGKIVGHVDLVYLTDNSCTECYNVSRHRAIIKNFGIEPYTEKYIDVSSSEGKSIVKNNGIELVPTIVISDDAQYYPGLVNIWNQVGKVAQDGSYIFTDLRVMRGGYKNLTSGEVQGLTQEQPKVSVS